MAATVEQLPSDNPFQTDATYSAEAVAVMRALSQQRRQTGRRDCSPSELLEVVHSLGYRQPVHRCLPPVDEVRHFVAALTAYQEQGGVTWPTCDDLLIVLARLGYTIHNEGIVNASTMPVDRRRLELDIRDQQTERRQSTERSVQERMTLTDPEHELLDALKAQRSRTGREFASSEELLGILWNLHYRPIGIDGTPVQWLDDDDRCRLQIAFTNAVEKRLRSNEFLTCRDLLAIVADFGFCRVD